MTFFLLCNNILRKGWYVLVLIETLKWHPSAERRGRVHRADCVNSCVRAGMMVILALLYTNLLRNWAFHLSVHIFKIVHVYIQTHFTFMAFFFHYSVHSGVKIIKKLCSCLVACPCELMVHVWAFVCSRRTPSAKSGQFPVQIICGNCLIKTNKQRYVYGSVQ